MDYILKTGIKGLKRLEIVNALYNSESISFLKKINIQDSKVILDIGCGNGIMTIELAKLASTKSKIIAIDQSPDQIEIAKENIKNAKIKNIEFITENANNLNQYKFYANFIYSRLMLVHQQCPDLIFKNYVDAILSFFLFCLCFYDLL